MTIPKLRDYQQGAVDCLVQSYSSKKRAPMLVLPTGGGKTVIFSHVAHGAEKKGNTVLILAHRQEILKQISLSICAFEVAHSLIAADKTKRQIMAEQFRKFGRTFTKPGNQSKCFVASVQTAVKRIGTPGFPDPDLIIVDECFPPGVMVDGTPIELLSIGDMVRSFNHLSGNVEYKRITKKFKSRPKTLCSIYFDDGSKITCTEGHPFYVPSKGYCDAKNIKPGMPVLRMQDMRRDGGNKHLLLDTQDEKSWVGFLRDGLLKKIHVKNIIRNNGKNKSKICVGQNEIKKSNENPGVKRKNEINIERNGPQANHSRRKRKGINCSAVGANKGIVHSFFWGFFGACHKNKKTKRKWLSKSLQSRYCNSGLNDCHRGGRIESWNNRKKTTGSEKRRSFDVIRVESVEIHKQDDIGTFGGMLPEGFVYNVEVEDNHNYFADGILVHNCHHAVRDSTWGKIIDAFPRARLLLVTATPIRLDGRGLGVDSGGFADDLIFGPTSDLLMERGFLSKYRVFTPPNTIDLGGVKTRAGDYAKDQLAVAVDKPKITGDVVKNYFKLAGGTRAVVFCVSVAHAEHVAEEFRGAGIAAASVDGSLDDSERERRMKALETGELTVLTSCDLISEGVDIPAIETAILLRPTKSLSLYLQQVGRALRPSPGKKYATIIDHVGLMSIHGFPDDMREWTLDGIQKREKNDEEEVKMQVCNVCYATYKPQKECPYCGEEAKVKTQDRTPEIDESGELVEISQEEREQAQREKRMAVGKARTLEELQKVATELGYSKGWAYHVFKSRAKKMPEAHRA